MNTNEDLTDSELTAQVAEVLGWTVRGISISGQHYGIDSKGRSDYIPSYATDIAAAWELVEKMTVGKPFVLERTIGGTWWVTSKRSNGAAFVMYAETAPRAIALAFLKWHEQEKR